ncbi:hypothetical protein PBY51_021847 [Eleginops maclovinus]|uniref:Uncharacterized protein n=1 Tax=Eleginops maclovinus TaxID=56733 RepID=A0AAN8AMJ4_ELEMC|nr:hypothetical protein PBY51_021847 [Eleginops maclovinus]
MLLQPVHLSLARSKPKQQQQQRTIARKTEGVGGGGEEGRVLMTIDLELTRRNGEEKPAGDAGRGRSALPGFLSRLSNQLTFKK